MIVAGWRLLNLIPALIVSAAIVWAARQIVGSLAVTRARQAEDRLLRILETFAAGIAAADREPRAMLVWQPLAGWARKIFPVEFATLDRASGGTFPFSKEQLEAAHARWTADWLAWESTHDADYKAKAAAAEQELSSRSPLARVTLEAIEREKLDRYQRRYEEYIRVAKTLQSLIVPSEAHSR